MHPALPEEPSDEGVWQSADEGVEVGDFRAGSPLSQWALARYLVGRAIGESVGNTLLLVAIALLVLAAAGQWSLGLTFLTVILVILAVLVLLLRWVLISVLRRLTAADRYGPVETRLRELVSDTRGDVLRELRRAGLPSHTVTLPLLAVRLAGRRREQTLSRMRSFEIARAVPKARLDELHLLLRGAVGRPAGPARGDR
jgi:membrane protein implicated in regulation of membrane protease activity